MNGRIKADKTTNIHPDNFPQNNFIKKFSGNVNQIKGANHGKKHK